MTEDQLPQGDGSKDQMQKFLEQVELEYVNQSGKKNFHSMPIASGSLSVNQPSSNAHIPINKDVDAHESVDTHGTSSSTNSNIVTTQLIEIVKTLVENQNYSKLPSPEPGIFSGDLLHYPIWIQAFETLIENKTTRTNERIHFLRKYVAGEAKEAIDGLLLLNSDDAYQKAKEMLSKRFGDPFAIASAYRQKLESWPKIQNSDAKGLRKFTDFLAHCEKAMDGISSLRVLDDDQENRKMAAKLPKWITNRWAREVYQYKEDSGMFPSFKKFVKFLIKESDIANDPVFSAQNQELPLSKKPKDTLKPFKVASTFSVGTQKEDEHGQQCCLVCKSSHDIDICEEFLKKTVQERKEFAMINRLCFGCLKEGHRSKDCKERKTCKNCNRLHPSSLHAQRNQIPRPEAARQWTHTERIAEELMPYREDIDVGLLIGLDCTRALIPREVIAGDGNNPYALKTDLGWGIIGKYKDAASDNDEEDNIGVSHRIISCEVTNPQASCYLSRRTKTKEVLNPLQVNKMFELDFSEVSTKKETLSYEEKRFLQKMENGIVQRSDGHYQMPLPFREEIPNLPNNKALASHRLKKLQQRMAHDDKYYSMYKAAMDEVIEKGYAEKIPESKKVTEDGKVWYIPHHGVFHPKKPEKLRVVYDCSARYKGESLNEHLLAGPDLTNNLVGVLCRFRQEPFAFIGDIEGMFHQFKVEEEHRDFLRFLWWENGNLQRTPDEYRMTVHLFGAKSSPGCSNYGLKKIADDYEDEFGSKVADFIRNDFYVDDGLKSLPTEEQAISMVQKSKQMCARGGLRLHKFTSNSRQVIESIPPEDRAKDLKELDLQQSSLPLERALGVQWYVENDVFQFKIVIQDKPLTRRGILSTVSSIYDPLGFIAPVVLTGKRILQELTRDKIDWDEPVPETLKIHWEKWKSSLPLLENLHIDRCYKPHNFGTLKSVELHHFSDASDKGYGQCSYLRLINNQDQVHCSFVMGKARVTPLKVFTIPRLELTAALLSAKVSSTLQRELEFIQVKETFWTDSQVVLGYISNDARRFHVFVSNRVQQIRDQTSPDQWKYVKSSDNPADDASRGLYAKDLNTSSWLQGPQFLWKLELPQENVNENLHPILSEDPEVKKAQVLAAVTSDVGMATILQRLEYFSDWYRAKKAIALCIKFMTILQNRSSTCTTRSLPLLVKDLIQAEQVIIKAVQEDAFAKEKDIVRSLDAQSNKEGSVRRQGLPVAKSSSLYRLDPFIDENGILRVGGRIRCSDFSYDVKHPIILPRKGHITELLITFHHERINHQGRGITLNELRSSGYWIIGGSSAVGRYITNCVTCSKLRSKTEDQKMADLPNDRLQPAPPFTFCAVDYFGPWYIKEGRKELKRYGVLFTCMACRAIHLETANSLDTSSFINALRRFISRRGPIRQLRSDRGTNFVGAKKELQEAVKQLDQTKIQEFLLKRNCDWFKFEMNVPSSSHMGGSWERQIRTVRSVLSALLEENGRQLDDESLRTLMCETESVVNSRPLSVENLNSPNGPEPLTPNHLLTSKTQVVLPPPSEFQRADLYSRRRWRRVQHLINEFWSRWKKEFILSLQQRQKWIRPRRNLQVNDIVLIKDGNAPRNQWPMARVEDTTLDSDGLVRK
ncbi:hypothetical protein QZH41_001952, partial [Actinostola sp. cb2023]